VTGNVTFLREYASPEEQVKQVLSYALVNDGMLLKGPGKKSAVYLLDHGRRRRIDVWTTLDARNQTASNSNEIIYKSSLFVETIPEGDPVVK
jgi:hypothetical protein